MDTVFRPSNQTDASAKKQYETWLTTIRGIGPTLAKRIVKTYPDYFELAASSAEGLSEQVKGLSLSAAQAILDTIAEEEQKAEAEATPPAKPKPVARNAPKPLETVVPPLKPLAAQTPPIVEREVEMAQPIETPPNRRIEEQPIDFFSKPLDFKPVIERQVQQPVSIDALKRKHQDRQMSLEAQPGADADAPAAQRTGAFATFKKPDVQMVYDEDSRRTAAGRWISTFLPLLLVLGGIGLIGYAAFALINPQSPGLDSSPEQIAPTPSDNGVLRSLTFADQPSLSDLGMDWTDIGTQLKSWTTAVTTLHDAPPSPLPSEVEDSETTTETEPEPSAEPTDTATATAPEDISVAVYNGNGQTGSAGTAAQILRSANFDVVSVGNANNYAYQTTTLFFAEANRALAEQVLAQLSDDFEVVLEAELYPGQTQDVVVVVGRN